LEISTANDGPERGVAAASDGADAVPAMLPEAKVVGAFFWYHLFVSPAIRI
jgi:hypothetical protein